MNKFEYVVRLADNSMILGHRLSEWCGHGPFLEQDMAMTNIALDLIGQARSLYALAAEIQQEGKTEDDIAFLRYEHEYKNILLVEQPNGDFAHTIARQFFFSAYQLPLYNALYEKLSGSKDEHLQTLRGILEKAIKEVNYHLRWSGEWVIRLGDGTDESHDRMQKAVEDLYRYTGEAFTTDGTDTKAIEEGYGVDPNTFYTEYKHTLEKVISEAGLTLPQNTVMQTGGKQGRHSEHMGYILTEMQYMQRAYPNASW